jgi:quercetin dioxygenase-like cupin family protein
MNEPAEMRNVVLSIIKTAPETGEKIMSNQQIIKTENVLVRVMVLAEGSSTDWHYHTEVNDFFVCLTGVVRVETKNPDKMVTLYPGQRTEIIPPQIHRVINNHTATSEYLLAQGVGTYDFIKV